MYEGWKKDDSRHTLVNKQYIAGIMKPKEIKKLRDARVYQEYKEVKKLNKLQNYLSSGLARYQDEVEVPKAPEGIEYRNMGTQESQIFSKLKKRFCSGRKAFSEHGANALAKVCVLSEKFSIEELETPIPIDTSVEDWIKEIEENVKANKKMNRADKKLTEENNISNKILK